MGIGRRPKRRIANGSSIERQNCVFAYVIVVDGGNFHEEIMWVLSVHNGPPESRLALLEQFRISFAGHGRRFETKHSAKRQSAASKFSLRHWHKPICRKKV